MATRALKHLSNAVVRPFTIGSGQSVYLGKPVIFSGSDTAVQDAGSNSDLMIGVVLSDGTNAGYATAVPGQIQSSDILATQTVEVALFWPVIVPMLVGTGGSTRGKKQQVVSTGITDATANPGASGDAELVGTALQSGVAGDVIGVGIGLISRLM